MAGRRAARPDDGTVMAVARRVVGGGTGAIEPMRDGGSTFVYRLLRGDETFYLRLLPEIGDTFAPEVRAHALLREAGVRVPAIVGYEPRDPATGLSVLVTTEIPGQSLARAGLGAATLAIVADAGRDLARLNHLPVAGFGWVRRDADAVGELAGEHPTNRAFLTASLDADLALLGADHLAPAEVAAVRATIARHETWLDTDSATLAHGDLDATHIYQRDDRYSGLIDLGEMRGTDRWYDLAHFALRDGERLAAPLLPWLLAGYAEVAPIPADHPRRITFAALVIGVRYAARTVAKRIPGWHDRSAIRAIRRGIAALA